MIFVSVIIPNYNHARFLKQRIESILAQTYKEFEIIILDDCSMDGGASKSIIEQYRKNPYVSNIVYNEKNSGSTFRQWEKGINLAKGDFIWIAESDDYCAPTLLQELVNQILAHPTCSLVYCLSQMVDFNGNRIGRDVKTRKNTFLQGRDFVRRYMCCENPVYNASSAIFKKSITQKIDKQYMNYKGAGDRLFWIEIAEKGDVAIVNKPLNYFRQHGNKVTPRKTLDGTNLKEAKFTFNYLSKKHLSNFRKFYVKGFYLYLIYTTPFESEATRQELYNLWGKPQYIFLIQVFLGRLYVSLRYYLNLYL